MNPEDIAKMITEDPNITQESVILEDKRRWFHGTGYDQLKNILKLGLDPQAGKISGTTNAVYLTPEIEKANLYGKNPPGGHDIDRWIVVEVIADTKSGSPDEDFITDRLANAWGSWDGTTPLESEEELSVFPKRTRKEIANMMKQWCTQENYEPGEWADFDSEEFMKFFEPILNRMPWVPIGGQNLRITRPIAYRGTERIIAIYEIRTYENGKAMVNRVAYADRNIQPSFQEEDILDIDWVWA